MSSLKYGLTIPSKSSAGAAPPVQSKPASVFGEDAEDDDNDGGSSGGAAGKDRFDRRSVNQSLQKDAERRAKKLEQQTQKLLSEDASVYAFDDVYDSMQQSKETAKKQQQEQARAERDRPKYMQSLLQQAEERKKEQERREERRLQKEAEADAEQYAGKEKFVTSAYRAKLEQSRRAEEEERRKEEQERMQDVTKKKDLSGFYSNLLTRNVAYGSTGGDPAPSEEDVKASARGNPPSATSSATSSAAPGAARSQGDAMVRDAIETLRRGRTGPHHSSHRRPHSHSHASHYGGNGRTDEKEGQEQSMEELKAKFARRNTQESIEAARERYFARRALKQAAMKT